MFEVAELGQKVSKEEYKRRVPELRSRLLDLQFELKEANFSVVIVMAGVESAGRGETVHVLHEWMDPRFLSTFAPDKPSDEENERPYLWRFMREMPPHGRIGIFFWGWYSLPLSGRFHDEIEDLHFRSLLDHINVFEKSLTDNGTLLLKFWFHISKDAQKKRIKKLSKNRDTRWRVRRMDRTFVSRYDEYRQLAEETLRESSSDSAPWIIIDAEDERHRHLAVGQHLADAMARRLESKAAAAPPAISIEDNYPVSILDRLDLTQSLSKSDYEEQLEHYQARLNRATRKARRRGVSSILAFEGWDAAGKGGLIRRITDAMDSRDFKIIPIAAPTDEERAHHYLWRFWRHLPRAGRVTIFDRSWYGRVMVERIEAFARPEEWQRAYKEINDFEWHLHRHGTVLMKFWIHIDKDEQLRRFQAREQIAYKRFKITEEDYRNREKWPAYDRAVNDLVERCSTDYAPWTLVEGNDKRFARIKVLRTLCEKLESRL